MAALDRTIEISASGERIFFTKLTAETGGEFLEMEVSLKLNGKGPPLHMHLRQTEEFEVLAGIAGFQIGQQRVQTGAGGKQVISPGIAHTWWNAGAEVLRMRALFRPALGTETMLRNVFASANRHKSTLPGMFEGALLMMGVKEEYRLARPSLPVQRILFPLVIGIGKLLGKYENEALNSRAE